MLQGKQNEVMALPVTGHTVVLGTAGSGKTTVAIRRATYLANLPDRPMVLLVTFNNALVRYINSFNDSNHSGLVVESYHKFARGYLNSRGKMPYYGGIADKNIKRIIIERALSECMERYPDQSTLQRPVEFFFDEICFIQQFGFKNFEDYQQAERIGRSSAYLSRDNRRWVYAVYSRYLELRQNEGYSYDWDDIAYYVYCELENDPSERRYTHIIVDEGQDFSPMMIKSLVRATRDGGSFTFFGDVAQQIYGHRLSWRDSDIDVTKIWRFDINYRNPLAIISFAQDITFSPYWKKDADMIQATPLNAEGPRPVLLGFSNEERELEWMVNRAIQESQKTSVVVVCRSYEEKNRVMHRFSYHGQPVQEINRDTPGYNNNRTIYVSTFHSVKGLEFDYVFIPFLNKDVFPNSNAVEAALTPEDAYNDELKLLYVAATRSKYGLIMSYSGELSPLFPCNSPNYEYHTEEEL